MGYYLLLSGLLKIQENYSPNETQTFVSDDLPEIPVEDSSYQETSVEISPCMLQLPQKSSNNIKISSPDMFEIITLKILGKNFIKRSKVVEVSESGATSFDS
jgi:hypothetical protein